mmetsp:Transcript_32619/g.73929  ORF Transcript_32619/g.73929 Transcript_32619/m.73929 type:complete len:368 (-) Transcript_32619:95-1198(-)
MVKKGRSLLTKAGKKAQKRHGVESEDEGEPDSTRLSTVKSVNFDLNAIREAVETREAAEKLERSEAGAADKAAAERQAAEEQSDQEDAAPADPYLLADAEYIKKDTRWRNKQRTIIFATRGVTHKFRHLVDDIRKLMPHHKTEPKFEKKAHFHEVNEICELKSCNNAVLFEARKRKDLYMWVARSPQGPTMKFQVGHIHISTEVRLAGNCLLGSRPVLYFDPQFGELSYLRLARQLLIQAFGTPRNHPKSKPFHDHIMCFYYLDKKIWFRHYQVAPQSPGDGDEPERQTLTEIGPRFSLDPIRMFAGSFEGESIFSNAFYVTPTMRSAQLSRMRRNPYMHKLETRDKRQKLEKSNEQPEDPLDEVFA